MSIINVDADDFPFLARLNFLCYIATSVRVCIRIPTYLLIPLNVLSHIALRVISKRNLFKDGTL